MSELIEAGLLAIPVILLSLIVFGTITLILLKLMNLFLGEQTGKDEERSE